MFSKLRNFSFIVFEFLITTWYLCVFTSWRSGSMWTMRANKAKPKELHLGQGGSRCPYRWRAALPSRTWGCCWMGGWAWAGNGHSQARRALGCIKSRVGSRSREGILPLPLCWAETPLGMLHPPLDSSVQERMDLLEWVQNRPMKRILISSPVRKGETAGAVQP